MSKVKHRIRPARNWLAMPLFGLLLSSLQVVAATPAWAASEGEVIFEGAGWGHGIGLSQYGAYGMATTGSTYQAITAHYYTGSSVTTIADPGPIWVNLERNFSMLTMGVSNTGTGPGSAVQITFPTGSVPALPGAAISATKTGETSCSVGVTNPEQSEIVLEDPTCSFDLNWYDWPSPGQVPTTKITINGCTQADWNVSPTTQRPCQYARGQLHLRSGTGGLDLSAEMLLDDYVLGISEMPYAWPMNALKAQAVASRSYAYSMMLSRGNPATNSCDGWCHVKDTTADQRYVGWGHGNAAPWVTAVTSTPRQVITHPAAPSNVNHVVTAFYSSSSGGRTENIEEVWTSSTPRQYLTSVDDSVAVNGTVPNPKASWTKSIPDTTVAAALGLELLTDVRVTRHRSGSGSSAEVQFTGLKGDAYVVIEKTGSWVRSVFGLFSEYFSVDYDGPVIEADEMFFYRNDGLYRYHDVNPDGSLGAAFQAGSGYTTGWDAITGVDLDGDGQDEMFFYRNDGLYRYYDIRPDGSLGSPIQAGSGYTTGWDAITAVDLDGDGQDEMFFYRNDGLFRYYNIASSGQLSKPMVSGSTYTRGWDAITAVDLDGDGRDEMFFYRDDGLFRYYSVAASGKIGKPFNSGSSYTPGWSQITAIDVDGDGQDEMFFYRDDGVYRYYNVKATGALGAPMQAGSDYTPGWDSISAVQLDKIPK